jgi:hypothetical protein
MFKKALLIALVIPVLTAATPTATIPKAPQTMRISSWQSEGADGVILSGTQTVTIINTSATSTDALRFGLEPPPCDCALAGATPTNGTVGNDVWEIGDLLPGASASLDLVYVARK